MLNMAEKEPEQVKKAKGEWQYEKIASILGKWAWVILLLDALIYIILGIYYEVLAYQLVERICAAWRLAFPGTPCSTLYIVTVSNIWYIVGAIATVLFAIMIVKPRFSDKCAAKEWDVLMEDVLVIGGVKIPWMFILSLIAAIFAQGWGTFPILIPAILLIFAGPKPYEWKE